MWSSVIFFLARLLGKPVAGILYSRVGGYASISPTTICMLHNAEIRTPCPKSSYFCGSESKISVLNFDAIKDKYCHDKRIPSLPSVDAVTYKGRRFLFIEIKSWQNFERYQIKQADSQVDIQRKIVEKASKFNLRLKVEKSLEMCKKIMKDEDLFIRIPVTYVLVTDVDSMADPLARFKSRLRALAYKSVYIPLYTSASEAELSTVGMDVRYVFCRKFDQFYDSL